MKTILFDYQAFEMQPFGGVSLSYAQLISHLRKEGCVCGLGLKESDNVYIQNENIKPLYYTHDRLFGRKKRFIGQRTINKILLQLMGHPNEGETINQDYCIKLLKKKQFDIFEPTFFNPYFLPFLYEKPFVITVHDMIPERMKHDYWQIEQKKLICPLAAHIHVPSGQTKKDLVEILNIAPDKITVIPHGAPAIPDVLSPSIYPFPYILYVGARYSYKKFNSFIEECSIVVEQYPELRIVCTGSPFTENEIKLIAENKLTNSIIHYCASEQDLIVLYQNAVAFIYPSAYEGFGLPILEAWSCGCPVMLNNASCFPEVGGDAAIYFDINRKGDLAEHIISFIRSSSQDRNDLIAKGKVRLNHFSWDKAAKQLKHIYDSLS